MLRGRHADALLVSAVTGEGLDRLREAVDESVCGEQERMSLSLPARDGKALSFLERFADLLKVEYDDGRALVDVRISPRVLRQLHATAADVRHLES
jgi:GTP-binding protein HflX